jgi:hypothetical protein
MSEGTLNEICDDLCDAYFIKKDAEKEQAQLRVEFFNKATEESASLPLAQKVYFSSINDPEQVQKYNPGWRILDTQKVKGGHPAWKFSLEEDPAFKEYVHIVKRNSNFGYHIKRSIVSGSPVLDDERLKDEQPDLWHNITEQPLHSILVNLATECSVDDPDQVANEFAIKIMLPRTLLPLEGLDDELRHKIKPYLYEAPPTPKLLIRKAKKEELSDG